MAICRMTFNDSLMRGAVQLWKSSAQSPPCRRKASPVAASASFFFKFLISPAKTSGGNCEMDSRTALCSSRSGHLGCCSAEKFNQLDLDQSFACCVIVLRLLTTLNLNILVCKNCDHNPPISMV